VPFWCRDDVQGDTARRPRCSSTALPNIPTADDAGAEQHLLLQARPLPHRNAAPLWRPVYQGPPRGAAANRRNIKRAPIMPNAAHAFLACGILPATLTPARFSTARDFFTHNLRILLPTFTVEDDTAPKTLCATYNWRT